MNNILRKLQLTQCEILNEVVKICEKHDLKYFLIGGTLLGAVRHKGFIPWDDDLDIAMPREDYEKFISLYTSELDEKYFIHSFDTDKKYWLRFAKVRKAGTLYDEFSLQKLNTHKEIYIDIFPLDNSDTYNSFSKKVREMVIQVISLMLYEKIHIVLYRPNKTILGSFVLKLMKILSSLFTIRFLTLFQKKMMTLKNNKKRVYYVNYGSNYNHTKQTIPFDKYEPSIKLEFEGKLYDAPRDYEYILNRIYGDYMKLPPEEKRASRHLPTNIIFGDEQDEKI